MTRVPEPGRRVVGSGDGRKPHLKLPNAQHGDVGRVVQPTGASREHRADESGDDLGGRLVVAVERPAALVHAQQHALHRAAAVDDGRVQCGADPLRDAFVGVEARVVVGIRERQRLAADGDVPNEPEAYRHRHRRVAAEPRCEQPRARHDWHHRREVAGLRLHHEETRRLGAQQHRHVFPHDAVQLVGVHDVAHPLRDVAHRRHPRFVRSQVLETSLVAVREPALRRDVLRQLAVLTPQRARQLRHLDLDAQQQRQQLCTQGESQ